MRFYCVVLQLQLSTNLEAALLMMLEPSAGLSEITALEDALAKLQVLGNENLLLRNSSSDANHIEMKRLKHRVEEVKHAVHYVGVRGFLRATFFFFFVKLPQLFSE